MPRLARIGITSFGYRRGIQTTLEQALALTDAAGKSECDLVLLPEMFLRHDNGSSCTDPAEADRALTALRDLAERYEMYVIAGLPLWDDGALFNAGVVIDRQGHVAGAYRKVHPTEDEVARGIVPADEPAVFELDFARVGVSICYDIGWQDDWRKLREGGAELVCWLSAYDGGFPLQAYAWTHKYYVASSVWSNEAMLIDLTGSIIAQTSKWGPLVVEDVNFDRRLFHAAGNAPRLAAVQQRYGSAVRVRSITVQNVLTLEPTVEGLDIAAVMKEFGLEPYVERIARQTDIQNAARERYRTERAARQPAPAGAAD